MTDSILLTDSYKFSHFEQYPDGMTSMQAHFCARGGEFDTSVLFGLQYFLENYIDPFLLDEEVEEAATFAQGHGVPFNMAGFNRILRKYGGQWPVVIRALPEGLVVPVGTPLFTVESIEDPDTFWCVSWLETVLSNVWYPSTVATTSREVKKIWKHFLDLSSDTPDEISFKHHDFGARGVTCPEQALLGGMAHLLSFLGSDTVHGIVGAKKYYDEPMAGFSISAAEHSTVTTWGRDREFDFYRNFIKVNLTDRVVPPGLPKIAACVSDSYNLWEAVKFWTEPEQLKQIKESDGTLVIRPDSGDPKETLTQLLVYLQQRLGAAMFKNNKGYYVLPPYLRIIQGDGINRRSTREILQHLTDKGYSASNLAFGSGGGLLQDVNRDTQKFAYKCNAAKINGSWIEVSKDPITDPGKRSRGGRLDVIRGANGDVQTVSSLDETNPKDSLLETVYDGSRITRHETFAAIRARMAL